MEALFFYSLKLSVCLGSIYLFYYLVLRSVTFYTCNRWFLLLGTGLSLIIPLVNVLPLLENQKVRSLQLVQAIPDFGKLTGIEPYSLKAPVSLEGYFLPFFLILFCLGVLVQGSRLLIQFISLYQLTRSATRLQREPVKIYQLDKNIAPFSFGKAIYLNQNLLQPDELTEIIKHELVHVRQKHTVDVLWFEFLCLINWYNPFVWLLKQAVRQNLEFIVDQEVLNTAGINRKYYQYLLAKVIGLPALPIANQFNISALKTRIIMMNKTPSNKREIAKFLFVLPIMAFLLLACQEDLSLADTSRVKAKLMQNAPPPPPPVPPAPEIPPPPPPAPPMGADGESLSYEAFLKRYPTVKRFSFQDKLAVVESKSGKVEKFNLNNKTELAQFQQRYGGLVPPPPPPVMPPSN